jgi:hypothetical protein
MAQYEYWEKKMNKRSSPSPSLAMIGLPGSIAVELHPR